MAYSRDFTNINGYRREALNQDPRPSVGPGWESALQGNTDVALGRYLSEFQRGGVYDPENVLALWRRLYTQPSTVSAGFGVPYAQTAMDLASRSAAIQAGNAAQGLEGLNPAARVAGLGAIAREAAGGVGNAGVSAYQTGLGLGQEGLNQERQSALGLFSGGLDRAYGVGTAGAQGLLGSLQAYYERKSREDQARQGVIGQLLGDVVGAGAGFLQDYLDRPTQPRRTWV